VDLKNHTVNFRICDVYLPDPATVAMDLYGEHLLQGRVIDVSDSGEAESAFAVVKVEGIEQLVIVAADRILGVL
jgi:hypothetical protein